MKKVSVIKEISIILVVVVSILAISFKVYATAPTITGGLDLIGLSGNQTGNETTNETTNVTANETTSNQIKNNESVAPTTGATNQAGSNYQNQALPQTGDASDYAIFLVIVVSAIVAVYAYKKVKEYNI